MVLIVRRSSEAPTRGFDVNQAPTAVAAASVLGMEDADEDPTSSSPNNSVGSFPLDLGRRANASDGTAVAHVGGERSSSHASDEDEALQEMRT